jgi:hypothetical protein
MRIVIEQLGQLIGAIGKRGLRRSAARLAEQLGVPIFRVRQVIAQRQIAAVGLDVGRERLHQVGH